MLGQSDQPSELVKQKSLSLSKHLSSKKQEPQLFTTQARLLTKETFENILGKEENAGNQQFLLFPNCLLPLPSQNKFQFFSKINFVANALKFRPVYYFVVW